MNRATLKRAAEFGARFLQTAGEATAYSRQQLNDLKLAAAMLKAAPDLIHYAPRLCGLAEAGPTEAGEHLNADKVRAAIERATDRSEGEKL